MSAENPVSAQVDPNPSEPPRSPLKLLLAIAALLIAILVFGSLDR